MTFLLVLVPAAVIGGLLVLLAEWQPVAAWAATTLVIAAACWLPSED